MPRTLPILYSFRRCPYAMRARLAIQVSGQVCQLREILLRDKAAEFLEVSPKGTVPVLVTPNGEVLEESLDLMDWALAKNDPECWLSPELESPEAMRSLILKCDTEFKAHLDHYKYPNRYEKLDPVAERDAAVSFLIELDKRLQEHPYLFGKRRSLADMAIAPFIRQFANVDRRWFDEQPWKCLQNWLRDFLSSNQFNAIMDKYSQWHDGDEITLFPANLK